MDKKIMFRIKKESLPVEEDDAFFINYLGNIIYVYEAEDENGCHTVFVDDVTKEVEVEKL